MKKYKWLIILLNLILLLGYFDYSVAKKEEILNNGKLVLLELAPVDPRSLMQGDYMQLRYKISSDITEVNFPSRGYCVVTINDEGVANKVRLQKDKTPLHRNEFLISYHAPNKWSINIGAESFFFQEGDAGKFEQAKYGALRIDSNGNSLLVGLYDEQLRQIK
jgi:uncharacterized membrane-anchored protein